MENATQFQFEILEVGKLLLKKQGITQGMWTVGVNFAIGVTNAGPNPETIRPSAIVSVDKIVLSRAEGPGPMIVDASNPGNE
jgi:hypothetical protein